MRGILYGVGVGPGDPELMTLKAVRMIRENEVIAVPGAEAKETVAYQIAVQAVPELADKELLSIYMPMTHDAKELEENHRKGAKALEEVLDQGKDIVFLTLGDPTIYSTFSYLQKRVEDDGYEVVSLLSVQQRPEQTSRWLSGIRLCISYLLFTVWVILRMPKVIMYL